jgi:hypothetical protein
VCVLTFCGYIYGYNLAIQFFQYDLADPVEILCDTALSESGRVGAVWPNILV